MYILALQKCMNDNNVVIQRSNHQPAKQINHLLLKKEQEQLVKHRIMCNLVTELLELCKMLKKDYTNFYEKENGHSDSRKAMGLVLCTFIDKYEDILFNDASLFKLRKWIIKHCNTNEKQLYTYEKSVPNQRASLKKIHNFIDGHFDVTSNNSHKNTIIESRSLLKWLDHDVNTMDKIRNKIACHEFISFSSLNNQHDDNIHRIKVLTSVLDCAKHLKADVAYSFAMCE